MGLDSQQKETERPVILNKDRIVSVESPRGRIVIAGIGEHTTSLDGIRGVRESLEKVVAEKQAENVVFLGEGSAVTAGVLQPSAEVAIFGGDQQAMACRAKELGVKIIDSWDMSLEDQLATASAKFGAENAILWALSQSAIALKQRGEAINLENTLKMLSPFGLEKSNILKALGDETAIVILESEETIDGFVRKRAGFGLGEVNDNEQNYRTLSQIASPENTEESVINLPEGLRRAALVASKLSEERDIHFKEKVEKYTREGKTVFVSCGGGHVEGFLRVLETETKSPTEIGQDKELETEEKSSSVIILETAKKIIEGPIPLITDKDITPPSGDKKDFVSLSPYWYVNEGGELVSRDGEINPETQKYPDSEKLSKAIGNIFITSLAARSTEDRIEREAFANHAISTLDAWFIDETTKMTPSFEYAQIKPGEERGNFWGIIEGAGLIRVIEGVNYLKDGGLIDESTLVGVKTWFDEYLDWLLTSKKAIGNKDAENEKERGGEKGMLNNHGTFYDVQVGCIADFLGKTDLVRETIDRTKERIKKQIEPDGEMPLEAKRATPYDYELFNLEGFCELALLSQKYDIDLWNWETGDRRGLRKAFEYFADRLEEAGDKPFKFDNRSGMLYLCFRAASRAYDIPQYWDLPSKFFSDLLADEATEKMFKKKEK